MGGFTLLATAGAYVVQRLLPRDTLEQDNDLKGIVVSIIGLVYAVVLGFVAIGVWERFDQAEVRTYDEASDLQEIYRDADVFTQRDALRLALRNYTAAIIAYDWHQMEDDQQAPVTRTQVESLGAMIRNLPARTAAVQNVHAQMLAALRSALLDRDTRTSMAATGLNPLMWDVLMIGAVCTIGFTYLFGFKHPRVRAFMIGALGATIGLVLFLTMSLDYPFRGSVHITPEAYAHAIYNYGLIDRATLHSNGTRRAVRFRSDSSHGA